MIEIVHSVVIMNRGGQETLLMNLMRTIGKSEISFSFLCSEEALGVKGDYDDEICKLGGHIYYLKKNQLSKIKFLKRFGVLLQTKRFFVEHPQFNIFHIHTCHAFYAMPLLIGAKMAGVKTIIIHSHNTKGPRRWLHILAKPFLNMFSFERYACSEDAAKWLFGKAYSKTLVVKNGIILDEFSFDKNARVRIRKELGIDDNALLIGHVGRFNFQKNHKKVIDVFRIVEKKCPDSRLVLVGVGELKQEIENYAYNCGILNKVIFAGIRNDVNKLMSAFDVFLFPSLFEGLGIVLIEAQAAGLPCVISNTIPDDVNLTKYVYRLSLEDDEELWADRIINCKGQRESEPIEMIRKNGYDIVYSASVLRHNYINYQKNTYA